MKMRRNLTLAALAAFVISHFLPAYSNSSGFACFAACWEMMLGKSGNGFSGGRFYYAGFAASNILFIGLAVALLARKRGSIPVTIVVMALLLHVLSWWVVHVLENPPQIDDIKIGYYVWLIAYGLLVAAHVWKVADGRSHPLPLESSPLNPT